MSSLEPMWRQPGKRAPSPASSQNPLVVFLHVRHPRFGKLANASRVSLSRPTQAVSFTSNAALYRRIVRSLTPTRRANTVNDARGLNRLMYSRCIAIRYDFADCTSSLRIRSLGDRPTFSTFNSLVTDGT
ncbi:MAG: hypothetical protein OXG53_06070 [Chloroflexi bacterium]|nr:hypothetical protein [Chloroflexota bacterium]